MILTPTYYVMTMYNVHQDATLLPVSFTSEDYILGNEKLPAISASASRDKDGIVHISVVNIDPNHVHQITLNFSGKKFSTVKGTILASAKVQDYNSFDEPGKIAPKEYKDAKLKDNTITINMPSASVIVLALN